MRRFDLLPTYVFGSTVYEMEPNDDGEWVRWEDVAAITTALQHAMAALPDSETAGPNGAGYKYAWDELKQQWVKEIRRKVSDAIMTTERQEKP